MLTWLHLESVMGKYTCFGGTFRRGQRTPWSTRFFCLGGIIASLLGTNAGGDYSQESNAAGLWVLFFLRLPRMLFQDVSRLHLFGKTCPFIRLFYSCDYFGLFGKIILVCLFIVLVWYHPLIDQFPLEIACARHDFMGICVSCLPIFCCRSFWLLAIQKKWQAHRPLLQLFSPQWTSALWAAWEEANWVAWWSTLPIAWGCACASWTPWARTVQRGRCRSCLWRVAGREEMGQAIALEIHNAHRYKVQYIYIYIYFFIYLLFIYIYTCVCACDSVSCTEN